MKRFLVAAATAGLLVTAAPATPASAASCHDDPCIYICWDCLDGPHVGCWRVEDVADRICV